MVSSNANQSFDITANSGFKIDEVIVDGLNQGAITSYTFNNVIANHTISATFGYIDNYLKIEAESYSSMSGVQTEACAEGGENVGYIENGDYMVFNNINFDSGAVSLDARVATVTAGGSIEVRLDSIDGPLVGTCVVTNTGGFQNWITNNCAISGLYGKHDLYLKFTGGSGFLFNINWIKFNPDTSLSVKGNLLATNAVNVYPNPVKNGNLYITSNSSAAKTVAVYDILGKQVLEAKTSNNAVNVSNLKGGAYVVRITEDGNTDTRKLIIE